MPQTFISGIHISFPFEPYDVQKKYMEKVLESLQTSKNAVLESPTGTGKTLCLLCSTLAWLEIRKAQHQALLANVQQDPSNEFQSSLIDVLTSSTGVNWGEANQFVLPKIIYSSRTHSQLSQAVQELKRTEYKHMRATVVGSRDQLCIHPEVSNETNASAKIHLCRAKVNARTCHYYNGVEAALNNPICMKSPVVDIEDLVQLGTKNNCCPYYLARGLKQHSDIIFMPYNYLLDSKARASHGIDLSDNVIIFDEAHNVEKMCEESASFELSSKDVAFCITEVTEVMQELAYIESSKGQSFDMTNINRGASASFTLNDLVILKTLFCELEAELDKIPLGSSESATFPGKYIFEFFAKVELTVEKKDVILDLLERLIQYLSSGTMNPMARRFGGLQRFADMIKVIFSFDKNNKLCFHKASSSYRVHVSLSDQKFNNRADFWTTTNKSLKQPRTLNYWCFNPGVGMQNLLDDAPRCIILTSGTLAPLDTFTHELQVPLPVQLENPHIVQKKQVWVGVISHGPDGTILNSSFKNRSDTKYIAALGNTIVNFARIVPEGLLVFFPSYSVMYECQRAWEQSNIWQSIAKHKTIFLETKIRKDFQEIMADFYQANGDKQSHGGAFLAICRGKVSEGLDFADHNGRAVIVTGLPYPPWKDPKVVLKMEYLNEQLKQTRVGTGGQSWYSLEASRAVNQAIGRVIRHKDDYGAIILCDSRFGEKKFQSQLSAWLRPRIQNLPNFGASVRSLSQFFKEVQPQPSQVLNETMPAVNNENAKWHKAKKSSSSPTYEYDPSKAIPPKGSREWLNYHVEELAQFAKTSSTPPQQSTDFFGALEKHTSQQIQNAGAAKPNLASGGQTASLASSYQDLSPATTKKRKFNVLGPKEAFDRKQQLSLSSTALSNVGPHSSAMAASAPPSSTKDQRGNLQQKDMCNFLLDVRKYSTSEQYERFKMAIKKYSQDHDLEVLVVAFSSFCSNPDIFNRLKVFRNFVVKPQRLQYDEYLNELEKQSLASQVK